MLGMLLYEGMLMNGEPLARGAGVCARGGRVVPSRAILTSFLAAITSPPALRPRGSLKTLVLSRSEPFSPPPRGFTAE